MKKIVVLSLLFVCSLACAQSTPDTSAKKSPWSHTMIANLNLSEASYTNWSAGGSNSLAYDGILSGQSVDNPPSATWTNSYKFAFGQTRLADQGLRKTDDQIDLESVLKYKLDSTMNPYIDASFLSQFAAGYSYSNTDSATQVSKFFDPAYFMESVGFIYTPDSLFSTRLGAALREVVTSEFNQYAVDPVTNKPQKTLIEGGFESSSQFIYPIDDHVLLSLDLELFAPVRKLDKIVVRSDNGLLVKVSKHFTVNVNALFINDATVTPRTQIKQTLALGFVYSLL